MRRRLPLWMLIFLITNLAIPATVASAAQQLDYDIPNGHFFTEANGQGGAGGTGFAITDEGAIPFWSEFQRLGGVASLGYPISGRFVWDGFPVQATQKVVLQWHPELGVAVFVNLYDRMHEQQQDPWLKAFRSIPGLADWTADTGLSFDQVKARHLALLNASAAIKARYNAAPGDPVTLYGLPMAAVEPDNAASPSYYVLRCQRVAIQVWVVDAPASGAHMGDVVVTNAGDEAKVVGGNGIFPPGAPLIPRVLSIVPTPAIAPVPPSRLAITSLVVTGAPNSPTIVIQGSGFGASPPTAVSPPSGASGSDFANMIVIDLTRGRWAAGNDSTASGCYADFVGVTVQAWNDNQVILGMGNGYGGTWTINPGDQIEVDMVSPGNALSVTKDPAQGCDGNHVSGGSVTTGRATAQG